MHYVNSLDITPSLCDIFQTRIKWSNW